MHTEEGRTTSVLSIHHVIAVDIAISTPHFPGSNLPEGEPDAMINEMKGTHCMTSIHISYT
uniref:Uncharacterized protein n=1 Tax=Salix viminalis TaxID=40686 RepID=A0A6N2LDK1_SALVM